MNFERLLLKAKEGNADAVLKILEIYKPLVLAQLLLSECTYQFLIQIFIKSAIHNRILN